MKTISILSLLILSSHINAGFYKCKKAIKAYEQENQRTIELTNTNKHLEALSQHESNTVLIDKIKNECKASKAESHINSYRDMSCTLILNKANYIEASKMARILHDFDDANLLDIPLASFKNSVLSLNELECSYNEEAVDSFLNSVNQFIIEYNNSSTCEIGKKKFMKFLKGSELPILYNKLELFRTILHGNITHEADILKQECAEEQGDNYAVGVITEWAKEVCKRANQGKVKCEQEFIPEIEPIINRTRYIR
jgi:hypothetical protein